MVCRKCLSLSLNAHCRFLSTPFSLFCRKGANCFYARLTRKFDKIPYFKASIKMLTWKSQRGDKHFVFQEGHTPGNIFKCDN